MQVVWHGALLTSSVEVKADQAWVATAADEFEKASLPEQGSWSVLSESILQEIWVLYQSIRPTQRNAQTRSWHTSMELHAARKQMQLLCNDQHVQQLPMDSISHACSYYA